MTARAPLASLLTATVLAAGGAQAAPAHVVDSCKKPRCKRHVVKPFNHRLDRIAQCESGRRWHIVGRYQGGLQFAPGTWRATGSRYARAHHAPPLEQKYRAVLWAQAIGFAWGSTAGWPICARR